MVVICYHNRAVVSMLIRVADPNRLTHKSLKDCSVKLSICRQTAQVVPITATHNAPTPTEGGLNLSYHKSDTSTIQQTPITAHLSNIVVHIMLNVVIILVSFSMLIII